MSNDDLAEILASTPRVDLSQPEIGFSLGYVLAWDSTAGTNQVRVQGSDLNNLPAITVSADPVSLAPGTVVAVLRHHNTFFVLGRIVTFGS